MKHRLFYPAIRWKLVLITSFGSAFALCLIGFFLWYGILYLPTKQHFEESHEEQQKVNAEVRKLYGPRGAAKIIAPLQQR